MRFLFISVVVCFFVLGVQYAWAQTDVEKQAAENLKRAQAQAEAIKLKAALLTEGVTQCLGEVYSMPGYSSEKGTGTINACLSAKGVNFKGDMLNPGNMPGYRPEFSALNNSLDATHYKIDIPNIDGFARTLEQGRIQQQVIEQTPAATTTNTNATSQYQQQYLQQQTASEPQQTEPQQQPAQRQQRIFIPSGKSDGGAKPIFLNR